MGNVPNSTNGHNTQARLNNFLLGIATFVILGGGTLVINLNADLGVAETQIESLSKRIELQESLNSEVGTKILEISNDLSSLNAKVDLLLVTQGGGKSQRH